MSDKDIEIIHPRKKLTWSLRPSDIFDLGVKMEQGVRSMLRWTGNMMHKIGGKISKGPLAFIGHPTGIILQETSTALVKTADKADGDAFNAIPSLVGAVGGLVSTAVVVGAPTFTNFMIALGIGAAGGVGGAIIGPAIAAGIWSVGRAIRYTPEAIANIPTGFKRSYHALANTEGKKPKIINPVADRGIEPVALPAPPATPAMLKLGEDAGAVFAKPASTDQKPESGSTPAPRKPSIS